MTDQTTTPVAGSQIDADGVSPAPGTSDTPSGETGSEKPNREARYRVERNQARTERDALAERIERMQRAEVERIASEHLAQGSDLLGISGNELAGYLNEETGEVDADRIRDDSRLLIQERPGLGKNAPAFDPSQGTGGSQPKAPAPTWGAIFS